MNLQTWQSQYVAEGSIIELMERLNAFVKAGSKHGTVDDEDNVFLGAHALVPYLKSNEAWPPQPERMQITNVVGFMAAIEPYVEKVGNKYRIVD
ncbi:hypothetical protein [Endozoicomonas sp. ALB032]|uniref:hypothetical protein n=1 Tax=Endozoicomonas sp. ALB032 TaxID=3403082 RepID=UPI003BB78D56